MDNDANLFTSIDEKLVKKWEKTGLLEDLGEVKKAKIARLLENTGIWLTSLDEKSAETLTEYALPIIRRVFSQIDFDVVAMPVYIGSEGHARTIETYFTGCELSFLPKDLSCHMDAEFELLQKAADQLQKFLQEKVDNGYKIVAYTPFVYGPLVGSELGRTIFFRGNFLAK